VGRRIIETDKYVNKTEKEEKKRNKRGNENVKR
jgi:hypothetical protein